MKCLSHGLGGLVASALLATVSFAGSAVARDLPDFTELYEKQGAAVVSIDVTQRVRRSRTPELAEDDPMAELFRRFGIGPRGREREQEAQSTGSGFFISSDGYIVTNAHVVDSADEVNVKLTDKREFKAKVIGTDKRTDVALLKIETNNTQKVTIGDPDRLKVGEWVVAIGKPFGLENTMTAGIVSAKGRDLPQENLVPFIQTDVAINPGNSGGPLFNLRGEVVGINSLIYSRTGGYMGLAFAIPIDVAMNVVAQLRDRGKVTRGRIGVSIQEVSRETAEAFGLPKQGGALVNSVVKGGAAEKAGVESGDIITRANGREVGSSSELPRIITAIRPGTRIALTVWRKGAARDLQVTVEEMPEEVADRGKGRTPAPKEKAKPNRMGLVVADLTDEQKKELGGKGGVVVEEVATSGRVNVQAGDIIVAVVNRGATTEIRNRDQFEQLVAKVEKGASVTLQIRRGENQFFTTLRANND